MVRLARSIVCGWLVLGLLALSGCGEAPSSQPGVSASTGAAAANPTEAGVAPDFELADLAGQPVRLSDSEGEVRLIDFWATWCPPCRDEIPMLNDLHRAYRDHGLTILAISDEKPDVIRDFADDVQMIYTNLVDPRSEVTGQYRVIGLPTAFLLDRDGRIVETFFGPKPRKTLEAQIRELLELPPAT